MAKKFVRGVTGIEDIESYDKTLTNVNDILSDGQHTYVHTKKGQTESYYNLTDNVKTITSSGGTITVEKSNDGTVNLNTCPNKDLEQDNLLTDYGIRKNTTGNTTKLSLEYTKVSDGFNLNNFLNGCVVGTKFVNSPKENTLFFVTSYTQDTVTYQEAVGMFENNIKYVRTRNSSVWSSWREQVSDKSVINALLALKQNTITNNNSIGVLSNNQLQQLFSQKQTYTHANGLLKTHVKNVSENTTVTTSIEEFNFTVKINKNAANIVVTLNTHDTTAFNKIMTKYGSNNTVRISGCVFTLSGSSLTVSTTNNTAQNYVITFSDILD